ncbi:MAG: DUF881 domain-containing protein [Syntrophomonadaceae bacterium]|nr:DUF881 domain-containing protein [Syntrophomonadaceae bacterium]
MDNKGVKISFMLACLVLGILIAMQFRATASYEEEYRSEPRTEELVTQLATALAERDALAQEVVRLREKLTTFETNDEAMGQLQSELITANMLNGLLPVQGPGIIITVNDNPNALHSGENPNDGLVHDYDLVEVVNELKASGAEAISINDERITPLTEIRCAGPTILVNWYKVVPPFKIRAIGDPEILNSGLGMRGGVLYKLQNSYGLEIQMEMQENIEIMAYSGTLKMEYSSPITTQETAE